MTFQKGKIKKSIFELEGELLELTGRLGYSNWKEYNNSFLIENRLISGCCDPSEYILFDKESGSIIKNLGTSLYQTGFNEKEQFIVTLKDLNTILFTNLNSNKITSFKLPKGRLENTLKNSNYFFADYLFQKIYINNNFLIIKYKYKESKSNWKIDSIKIEIK